MDEQTYSLINTGIYAGAIVTTIVGGIIASARYHFLRKKSGDETAEARARGEAGELRARNTLEKGRVERKKQLLGNRSYQELMSRRERYGKKLVNEGWRPPALGETLDAIFGSLEFE